MLAATLASAACLSYVLPSWTVFFVSIAAVVLAYGYFPATKLRHFPGPPFVPLVGNSPELLELGFHKFQQKIVAQYGPFCKYYEGIRPILLVTDLDAIRSICFENFSAFHDRAPQFQVRPNNGLLALKGQRWKRIRNALVPTFDEKHLRSFAEPINEAALKLISRIDDHLRVNATAPINIWRFFGGYTMQVVGATNFGLTIQSQADNSEGTELQDAAAFLFAQSVTGDRRRYYFLRMFPWLQGALMRVASFFFPRILAAIDKLDNFATRVIDSRRDNPEANKGAYVSDFVSLLLKATIKEEGDRLLTTEEIRAQCNTFLLAGYETTANTLAYTVYNLSLPENRPSLQKLLEEIDRVSQGKQQSYADLPNYPYLSMVLEESLRLFPPGAQFNRMCEQDVTINGHLIPAGTICTIPVFTIHHDAKNWPDPEKFIPERHSPELKAKRHPMSFLAFGAGQRGCIGMRFALEEAKLALITVLQRYTFELAQHPVSGHSQVPLQVVARLTLSPEDGVFVIPKARAK